MKKLLVVLGMLLLVAPVMAGQVSMTIDTAAQVVWNDAQGLLTIELTYAATNGFTLPGPDSGTNIAARINNFGSEMFLTGANATAFTPDITMNQAAAADISTFLSPKSFLFSTYNDIVTMGADTNTPAGASQAAIFSIDTSTRATALLPSDTLIGKVAAIYQFDYTPGTNHLTLGAIYANVGADNIALDVPYFNTGGPTNTVVVSNNGVEINPAVITPEPATMGLLGLGLVGLIIRRKKA